MKTITQIKNQLGIFKSKKKIKFFPYSCNLDIGLDLVHLQIRQSSINNKHVLYSLNDIILTFDTNIIKVYSCF